MNSSLVIMVKLCINSSSLFLHAYVFIFISFPWQGLLSNNKIKNINIENGLNRTWHGKRAQVPSKISHL